MKNTPKHSSTVASMFRPEEDCDGDVGIEVPFVVLELEVPLDPDSELCRVSITTASANR